MKALNLLKSGLVGVTASLTLGATALALSGPASEACKGAGGGADASGGATCDPGALANTFATVANVLIFIVGAVSVLMIIIGGLRYVLSGGDSAGVKSAKDTILYAIVGVIVAILAYAIVHFVIARVG